MYLLIVHVRVRHFSASYCGGDELCRVSVPECYLSAKKCVHELCKCS